MKTKKWTQFVAALAVVATLCFPFAANAGRNCNETAPDAAKTQKAIQFAKQVRDTLEVSGANVAAIGRIGSDQSKRGVRYTHVGYLLRDHPAGAWTVVHELNACGSGNSDLYDDGLANFYMDDLFEFETRIVIPSPSMQDRLGKALTGPSKRALHEPTYSSIANPWSLLYQNSNGWIIEILASAVAGTDEVRNREQAQRWLREHLYRPGKIHIGGGERAGARLFTPNVRFGDHPDTAWQEQLYEVNTGDAALDFLRRIDPESREIVQRLDGKAVVSTTPRNDTPLVTAKPPAQAPSQPIAPPVTKPLAMSADAGSQRTQLLQSIQGLVVSYACRPQGYLNQCRQLERATCEKQVADAVLRCFATVSDQQLSGGSEQAAMLQMQEIGYCAVERLDADFAGQAARTVQGIPCPKVRDYQYKAP